MPEQQGIQTEPGISKLMRTPRSLDIEITPRCNLRCRYCYFFNNPAVVYRELPTDEWLKFFNELGSLGVMNVVVAGGEPFMRDDLPVLLEGIVRNRMRFSLLSNGSLIDDEMAAFIAGTRRCDYVQVSVDGSRAEVHDAFRGRGSFDGALRGLRILRRYRISSTVRVTIHRSNVHDLENIAHFLLDELGLADFGTNSAGYMGTCCLNADEVMLNIEERKEAMATLRRLAVKYQGRISSSAGPLTDGRMWRRMEEARIQSQPAFPNGGRLTACGCPNNKISVRADGTIVPCSLLAHLELGRINRDPLAELWQNSPALNRLRNRRTIPLAGFEFCAGCSYIPYCTGNCPGLAYMLTGTVDHPSPDACLRLFLKEGGAVS